MLCVHYTCRLYRCMFSSKPLLVQPHTAMWLLRLGLSHVGTTWVTTLPSTPAIHFTRQMGPSGQATQLCTSLTLLPEWYRALAAHPQLVLLCLNYCNYYMEAAMKSTIVDISP